MGRKRNEQIKRTLLLAFVLVCVVLVGLVWADGLRAGEESLPGYYRELDSGSVEETPAVLPSQEATRPANDGGPTESGTSPGDPTPERNLDDEEM